MYRNFLCKFSIIALTLLTFATACFCLAQSDRQWQIHDMNWPQPKVVTPGGPNQAVPPSDAIILFDGKDLSSWQAPDGNPAKWKVENGYMEVVKRTGAITTVAGFGDCQLHIEWATPEKVEGTSQGRGNSGVFLMERYEVQVLDCYGNQTYPDGQAAALYGQYPPLVNVCRPPGAWQSYDIIFRRPRFDDQGKLLEPARMTVLHNNVLVQDNVVLTGPTGHHVRPPYQYHPDKLPIVLQDHGNPTRFRNIWIREIGDMNVPFAPEITPATTNFEIATPIKVNMVTFSKNAQIRYTLDGSEPKQNSELYQGPFEVEMNTVVSAATFIDGLGSSPVAVARYSLVHPGVNGLAYSYYEGKWDYLPDFSKQKAIRTGTTYEFTLAQIETRRDYFAVMFSGFIEISQPGDYTFYTRSDDGSKLLIDGKTVVDNDGQHGAQVKEGTVNLGVGKHAITLMYFDGDGGESLEVMYQGPEIVKQPIPPQVLFLKK